MIFQKSILMHVTLILFASIFYIDDIYSFPYTDVRSINANGGLRMRTTPDTKGKIITLIPQKSFVLILEEIGSIITIDDIQGKWTKVLYNNQTGYVFGGFLTKLYASSPIVLNISSESVYTDCMFDAFHSIQILFYENNSVKISHSIAAGATNWNNIYQGKYKKSKSVIELFDIVPLYSVRNDQDGSLPILSNSIDNIIFPSAFKLIFNNSINGYIPENNINFNKLSDISIAFKNHISSLDKSKCTFTTPSHIEGCSATDTVGYFCISK